MADILIQKILNNELLIDDLLNWITSTNPRDNELSEICTQKDFITFFLNVVHEDILSNQTADIPKISKTTSDKSFNISKNQADVSASQHEFSQNTFNMSCTTSTPKVSKSYSYDSSSIFTHSPKQRSFNTSQKDSEISKNSSFCLGDFIVTNRKSNEKKKTQKKISEIHKSTPKRINPTNLNERKCNSVFMKNDNSFNFQNSNADTDKDEDNSRDFFKREIKKFSTKKSSKDENIIEQLKNNADVISPKKLQEISPNPKLVQFEDQLRKIISIYNYLLQNGLVLSLVGELYFIISLLFNKCYVENNDFNNRSKNIVEFHNLFKSIHNVIYFACCILGNMVYFLKSLDKSTLKLLCENEPLQIFKPNLITVLESLSEEKSERVLNLYESSGKNNICFILDTDNRSNFPSCASFQSFKKQRDLFYEILKNWEDKHMVPGWKFEYALGRKVQSLQNCHNDPMNYMRLSRLFMDQLLNTCTKNTGQEMLEEKSLKLLTSLPNIDRDKFVRLKSRLVTKQTSNGISSAPDFNGCEEFYKEFILISSPVFLRHLCDAFISEIIELSRTNFKNSDLESNDNDTDPDTKKLFVNCLKSLGILAKFLGFIESMPYRYDGITTSTNLVEQQIKIREKVTPNFDAFRLLEDTCSNGSLILGIPWVCKYLSMLDPITLKTSYYTKIIEILIRVYRQFGNSSVSFPEYNVYLVKYSLGWFFELNNFPHNSFFETIDSTSKVCANVGIDRMTIVDQNILYIFCPYLDEIKKLLTSKIVTKDRLTVRHITPLTAIESPAEVTKKKIEYQLEEAFFNGHPPSLKKTVDFVAERIASTCVKHLCYNVVPDFKKSFSEKLLQKTNEWLKGQENASEEEVKKMCNELAKEDLKNLEISCETEVRKIMDEKLRNAIHSLLPMDTLPQMESVCIIAAERMCMEKVQQWLSTHIVSGIFQKEISKCSSESLKKPKQKLVFILPPGGNGIVHNTNTESGAHILDNLRELTVSILSSSKTIQVDFLVQFLENTFLTLTQRNDLSEAIIFMICFQLLEFFLCLVTFQPSDVAKVQNFFIKIWELRGEKSEELFSNLLCPRNIMLLAQSGPDASESWSVKAKFCVAILKAKLLTCECFESQCLGLFKSNLDGDTLKNVTTNFLHIFVDNYKRECKSSKFTFLLGFLSDYCRDLEIE